MCSRLIMFKKNYTRYARILKLLEPKENDRILDLGCGRAEIIVGCKDVGANIVGVDRSLDVVKNCQSSVGECAIICGDAIYLPFKNEIFDKVTFLDVMEHLNETDVKVCLTEIRRVMKKEGLLLITTPNARARIPYLLFTIYEMIFCGRRYPSLREIYYLGSDHVSCKNPKSLRKLLSDCGFDVIELFFDTPDRIPDHFKMLDRNFMYKIGGGTSL